MSEVRHVWALILAGGDGRRLRALTTQACGTAVPKQFCSLHGGHCLLEDAVARAGGLVEADRICTIVAQQHQQWWAGIRALERLPAGNLIVQPRNRGTAIGVLYSLLHILAKDPAARVVVLPADHYVREEGVLRQALLKALDRVDRGGGRPVLLGLEPDGTDTDLGYILPAGRDPLGGHDVLRFIEKPAAATAAEVIDAGGLWNTFIVAADAPALINLFLPRYAALVMEMQVMVSKALNSGSHAAGWPALVDLYERLPDLDFSHDLLEGREPALCVLRVPPCGWSDLGTPRRVGETLRRFQPGDDETGVAAGSGYINLAASHAHLERSRADDMGTGGAGGQRGSRGQQGSRIGPAA